MINSDNNFWKENKELTFAPGLSEFYSKDKSKGKQDSSEIMWAIHLCESTSSKYYQHPDKYALIADKFLKNKKFDWEKHREVIDFYKEVCLSDAERAITIWNETMSLRNVNIKKMYQEAFDIGDTDELVKLDRMLANTPKMFDDYKKIKADYEAEKLTRKGTKLTSLSDSDDI